MKPVVLPPGRARLSTKPPPTGSAITNTIGTVRVACCSAAYESATGGQDDVRRERDQFGGVFLRMRSASPAAQRVSIRTLRPRSSPALQPCRMRDSGPALLDCPRLGHKHADAPHALGCCARAASGHAAAPPSSVMNSRRLV